MELPSLHPRASDDRVSEPLDLQVPLAMTAVVHGHVQGVGFRAWVLRHAQELQLTGQAVNNADGTVGVSAEGPRWAVRELLKLLSSSETPGAVHAVDSHFGPVVGHFRGFESR